MTQRIVAAAVSQHCGFDQVDHWEGISALDNTVRRTNAIAAEFLTRVTSAIRARFHDVRMALRRGQRRREKRP